MNYWPAHSTHLAETAEPYHAFVDALRPPGRASAERMFATPGWVVHNETNPFGFTGVHDWASAFWFPEAAAWLAHEVYDAFRFSGDTAFLAATAYPILREAAEFWLDTLHTDPRDGTLVVAPSYSPEHGDFTAGAAMSQQIVRQLLGDALEAAALLDTDAPLRCELARALDAIDEGLRIGSWGQLQEWKRDLDDPADTHRHVSHLFALHPGDAIVAGTPQAAAAATTLDAREQGDGPGWSKAWRICLRARLHDGAGAHAALRRLLGESTLPNLWDSHPPFQIDGNLGSCAGIAEMLVQSHHGHVEILPALPAAWPSGSVRGLRARGDVTLDITWSQGKAQEVRLRPGTDDTLQVAVAAFGSRPTATTEAGEPVAAEFDGALLLLPVRGGSGYVLCAEPGAHGI
jgi:alpha-L-fucosidase 2